MKEVDDAIRAIEEAKEAVNKIEVTNPDDIRKILEARGYLTWGRRRLDILSKLEDIETDGN